MGIGHTCTVAIDFFAVGRLSRFGNLSVFNITADLQSITVGGTQAGEGNFVVIFVVQTRVADTKKLNDIILA